MFVCVYVVIRIISFFVVDHCFVFIYHYHYHYSY